jgi:uncharacterized protein (DUF2267 family)
MTTTARHDNPFEAVLHWLRSGYPEGIPPKDYHPVLALLRRSLTDDQLDKVVENLQDQISGPAVTTSQIREAVAEVARVEPDHHEIQRVSARLAAAGWPLATP